MDALCVVDQASRALRFLTTYWRIVPHDCVCFTTAHVPTFASIAVLIFNRIANQLIKEINCMTMESFTELSLTAPTAGRASRRSVDESKKPRQRVGRPCQARARCVSESRARVGDSTVAGFIKDRLKKPPTIKTWQKQLFHQQRRDLADHSMRLIPIFTNTHFGS